MLAPGACLPMHKKLCVQLPSPQPGRPRHHPITAELPPKCAAASCIYCAPHPSCPRCCPRSPSSASWCPHGTRAPAGAGQRHSDTNAGLPMYQVRISPRSKESPWRITRSATLAGISGSQLASFPPPRCSCCESSHGLLQARGALTSRSQEQTGQRWQLQVHQVPFPSTQPLANTWPLHPPSRRPSWRGHGCGHFLPPHPPAQHNKNS